MEVEWHGKKIFLKKDKLDEWHSVKSDEQRVDYINSHPDVRDPVAVHRMKKDRNLQEPDDLVLVSWSGNKVRLQLSFLNCSILFSRFLRPSLNLGKQVLLLERAQLDEWYHSSFEDHVDFVQKHPETILK